MAELINERDRKLLDLRERFRESFVRWNDVDEHHAEDHPVHLEKDEVQLLMQLLIDYV